MHNATLQKFLDLKKQIADLNKEAEFIKAKILEKGSFETSMFTVEVTTQT